MNYASGKPIEFSQHALEQMTERGATESEVIAAIREGERSPAKKNRTACRRNFPYQSTWGDVSYGTRQVMPIIAEEDDCLVVVTVYVFYF